MQKIKSNMLLLPLKKTALVICLLSAFGSVSVAKEKMTHGLSSFGDLKYASDFKHFDYVNPQAPKGGLIRLRNLNSFDSVNPFILKGTSEILNADIGGDANFNFASLMTPSNDEPDAVYGLVAKHAILDDADKWVEFHLRQGPIFHDGTPITASDVAFTFHTLVKDGHPRYRQLFRDVETVQVLSDDKIRFSFKKEAFTRGLPVLIGRMPILSQASFDERPFKKTTLEPLLGSGPYKMVAVDPGRSATYKRIENHWADTLPVHVGRYNFDEIKVDYYRDRTIATEAFFAGNYDFREEFTSRVWATEYDGKPAVEKNLIQRDILKSKALTGFQAFFFNTRLEKFKNPLVRKALTRMFDYEWTNKNLFYGSYARLTSVFENSSLKATGLPTQEELALLEPWRAQLPEQVFKEAYMPPITDGSGKIRTQIRAALKELKLAGWTIQDKKLKNEKGEQMSFEFLLYDTGFTRIINPFIRNLERIGVEAKVRILDVASWQNRLQAFDFDIITRRLSQSAYPGTGLRDWWGSKSADIQGGYNLAGVKNEAIDALVEEVIKAKDVKTLTIAARALDRALMWGHYTIPQWYKASHFIAYWDKFGRPDKTPPGYNRSVLDTWWIDTEKAAAIDAALNQ
ncbi:extracellular solute-binding protein [Sneathiella aquimaris]|uniref:extracellular solute-binding protein n=1 Tax=Sneathiella aquimaris TaxID=2599305 RepID=UPI00146A70E7|nr:extracellular solute-binding protein [Sneathiella aquimaris]